MRDAIRLIYPDILDSQFFLQDDGAGPYFKAWTYPQPQPSQAQIDAATSILSKEAAHARINASYEAAVGSLTAGYPDTEIASWPKQEAEARAWLADSATPTPWISSAAAARGISISQFVALVIANADALAPMHGALSGKRQSLRDQIDALGDSPTLEQLDSIQW